MVFPRDYGPDIKKEYKRGRKIHNYYKINLLPLYTIYGTIKTGHSNGPYKSIVSKGKVTFLGSLLTGKCWLKRVT
jgi:hypothetical protein